MTTYAQSPTYERIVVRRNSWHFRYFMWIRRFWGLSELPERTSICPYCQTIFWFTFFAVILSPLIVLGWCLLKGGRTIYKLLDAAGMDSTIDFIDRTVFGTWLEEASETEIQLNPAGTTILTSIIWLFWIAALLGIIFCLGMAIYQIVTHLSAIPYFFYEIGRAICWGVLYVGYAIWHVLAWIAWLAVGVWIFLCIIVSDIATAATYVWSALAWFFTNAALWLGILKVLSYLIIFGGGSFGIGLVAWRFSQTSFAVALWDKVIFKLNGYGEAKRRARERREAEQHQRQLEERQLEEQQQVLKPTRKPNPVLRLLGNVFGSIGRFLTDCVDAVFDWVHSLLVREIPIGQTVTRVLTPLGLFFSYLGALKKGICPLMEFLDDETIAKVEEIAKKCEGNTPLNVDDYGRYNECLNLIYDYDKKLTPRTKQSLYQQILDNEYNDKRGLAPFPCRIRSHVAQYILGMSTFEMLADSLKADRDTLYAIRVEKARQESKEKPEEPPVK